MKKFYNLLPIFIIPFVLLLYSNRTGSPGGKTNSPGDGMANCTQCHAGNTLQSQSGWITSDIPSSGYLPGEAYIITATGTDAAAVRFGFELTAEDGSNNKIGTFSIFETTRTKFTNNNTAVTHTANGINPSGGTISWQASWVAPAAGTGDITFYAAFNAANGNGSTSGDQIYASTYTVNEFAANPQITSVQPDHAEQGALLEITILGTETSWTGGVSDVSFLYHPDNSNLFSGTDITVVSDTELTVNVSVPASQEVGNYDVKVNSLTLENAFTVDIASSLNENLLARSLQAFPNPTSGDLYLNLPDGSEYKVVDILGKEYLRNSNSSDHELIDFSGFQSGIYFIQVMQNGEVATKRIVKK